MRDLCDKVSREDFKTFVETNEAPEDLVQHIYSCEKCTAEIERCSDELARALKILKERGSSRRNRRK